MRRFLTILLCLAFGAPALAAAPSGVAAPLLAGLHFQTGKVSLPGGIATLDLPPGFHYLNPQDTSKLLVDGWGNPPAAPTLGMVLPSAVDPLGAAGWGVIVTYDQDGHVDDANADRIDYRELLAQMRESVDEHNPARRDQGYAAMTLIGWAEPPRYDKARRQLHWAKELHTEGSNENGLNYDIRILGREGVLVLNAVAGMDQLDEITRELYRLAAHADFTPGRRYADFDSKTDKLAGYGLATLVAGGVAAKLGLFGKLLALLLVFKKSLLVALAAGGAGLYMAFGRKKATVN